MGMTIPFLEAARAYRNKLGWSPIPNCPPDHQGMSAGHLERCKSPGKMPLIKEWQRFSYKLPTEDELEGWGKRWPQANVGGCTGPLLGIALDIDEGGDEILRDRGLEIPDTPINLTGRGEHAIFQHPGFNVGDYVKLLPGLDIRGDRGQIILPPSVHPSGRIYTWEVRLHPSDTLIAPVPPWLIALLKERSCNAGSPKDRSWVAGLLANPILEGQRNDALCRLTGYLHRVISTDANVSALIHSVNESHCKPPLDEAEVDTIINSVLKKPGVETDAHSFRGFPAAPLPEAVLT